jgi:hypothetical protein
MGFAASAARFCGGVTWKLVWWLLAVGQQWNLVARQPFTVQYPTATSGPVHLGLAELRVFGSRALSAGK